MLLSDLYNKKTAILAGAGISLAPPSNLPLAYDFLEIFLKQLGIYLKIPNIFDDIIKIMKEEKQIRFEKILSIINEITLNNVQLVEIFGLSNSPNIVHKLLASQAALGHLITTTNFDKLIELACIKETQNVYQFVNDEDFSNQFQSPSVYKLHGSWEIYHNKEWKPGINSIKSTLESVCSQGLAFQSSPRKRDFFQHLLENRDLLVMGYSGSDVFDIMPMLCKVKSNQCLIWIDHNNNISPPINFRGKQCIDDLSNKNLRKIMNEVVTWESRTCENLFVIYGQTEEILKDMLNVNTNDEKANDQFSIDLNLYFKNKCNDLNFDYGVALLFKAKIYEAIGDYKKVLDNTKQAMVEFQKNESDYNKIRFSQASHFFLSLHDHFSDKERAKKLKIAKKLVEIDKIHRPDWLILSKSALATAYLHEGEISKALATLKEAIDEGRSMFESASEKKQYNIARSFLTARLNYGYALIHIGQYFQSYSIFQSAESILEKLGMITELASCKLNIGIALMEIGHDKMKKSLQVARLRQSLDLFQLLNEHKNLQQYYSKSISEFNESRKYLKNALEICENLFEADGASRCWHELGILNNKTGEYKDAIKCFTESIKILEKTGNNIVRATVKKEMSIAMIETNDLSGAEKHLDESDKILLSSDNKYYYAHNLQTRARLEQKRNNITMTKELLKKSALISKKEGDMTNYNNCSMMLKLLS